MRSGRNPSPPHADLNDGLAWSQSLAVLPAQGRSPVAGRLLVRPLKPGWPPTDRHHVFGFAVLLDRPPPPAGRAGRANPRVVQVWARPWPERRRDPETGLPVVPDGTVRWGRLVDAEEGWEDVLDGPASVFAAQLACHVLAADHQDASPGLACGLEYARRLIGWWGGVHGLPVADRLEGLTAEQAGVMSALMD